MTYLLFATALALSAVAAYYSIMGLVAIFAAATIPILVMGSLLEVSKLVVASWLYRSWKKIPILMKSYFTLALIILMVLTSMGIFGFLSKAHLDQAVPTGEVVAKLSLIDEKINTERENLNASRAELNQLDAQVNETINRSGGTTNNRGASSGTAGVERSIAIRKAQQKDRQRILNEIGTAQAKIAKLQEERAPIAAEVRKVEAEVGPIKYIAALIYGDTADQTLLESAVRIVIMMIVAVFDPLAVLMLVAANWQMRHKDDDPDPIVAHVKEVTEKAKLEPTIPPQPRTEHIQINDFVKADEQVSAESTTSGDDNAKYEVQLNDDVSIDNRMLIESDEGANDAQVQRHKELGRYLSEIDQDIKKHRRGFAKRPVR